MRTMKLLKLETPEGVEVEYIQSVEQRGSVTLGLSALPYRFDPDQVQRLREQAALLRSDPLELDHPDPGVGGPGAGAVERFPKETEGSFGGAAPATDIGTGLPCMVAGLAFHALGQGLLLADVLQAFDAHGEDLQQDARLLSLHVDRGPHVSRVRRAS